MQDNITSSTRNLNPAPGYGNPGADNKPKISPKILAIVAICFVVVIVIVSIVLFRGGAGQNLDDAEPAIEYAGTDTKIAGIQFLINEGLTREQYLDVFDKLTKFADEKFPNAKYLNYVEGSQTLETKAEAEEESVLTPEEETALLASIAAAADSEETPSEYYSEDREDDGFGSALIVFEMTTDTNESVKVKVDSFSSNNTVNIEVYDTATNSKLY